MCPSLRNQRGGGGHTRLQVRGWGSPNFNDLRKSLVFTLWDYLILVRLMTSASLLLHTLRKFIWIYLLSSVVFTRQNYIQLHYNISSRGRILGCNWDKSLKSFPPSLLLPPLRTDSPPPRPPLSARLCPETPMKLYVHEFGFWGGFLTGRAWL